MHDNDDESNDMRFEPMIFGPNGPVRLNSPEGQRLKDQMHMQQEAAEREKEAFYTAIISDHDLLYGMCAMLESILHAGPDGAMTRVAFLFGMFHGQHLTTCVIPGRKAQDEQAMHEALKDAIEDADDVELPSWDGIDASNSDIGKPWSDPDSSPLEDIQQLAESMRKGYGVHQAPPQVPDDSVPQPMCPTCGTNPARVGLFGRAKQCAECSANAQRERREDDDPDVPDLWAEDPPLVTKGTKVTFDVETGADSCANCRQLVGDPHLYDCAYVKWDKDISKFVELKQHELK